jgi:hypothetical protein
MHGPLRAGSQLNGYPTLNLQGSIGFGQLSGLYIMTFDGDLRSSRITPLLGAFRCIAALLHLTSRLKNAIFIVEHIIPFPENTYPI